MNVRNYGFPEAWVEEYIRNGYERIDPITSQAQTSTRPFWWSEVRRPLGREQERYLLALRRARLGDGLAVPVFGPAGRNGYVGLGFGRAVPHVPDHVVTSLLVAAQLAHGRFCELLTRGFEAVRLSPREREREILLWVAQGKSNSVIAEITAISPRTVDTHLRRIFQKLGTNDRTTAVLRAVSIAEIA